ncbi:MAG: HEAT repeat domain-containing protein, partial [Chloroflexi bacterium]|nr:HEAT repeat domain-containing protein [Chloroflexota bacterium]MBU1747749.1 HEAT repeat domain-containing protein [Chloroflexota bacterium]
AVEPLIAALKDHQSDVCKAACTALGQIGAPAVKPLIAVLKDQNRNMRQSAVYAAKALVMIGAPAVKPLIAALKQDNKGWGTMAEMATDALGQIGDARAVEPLIARLERGNLYAAAALGQIGDARAVEPLIAALARETGAQNALWKIGAPAVEPLIAALKDTNWVVRRNIVTVLGWIKDARAVEPLIATLKDPQVDVRKAAAYALEQIGWQPGRDEKGAAYWIFKREWEKCIEIGTSAIEPLITTLKDPQVDVRDAAADTLEQIGWQPGRDEKGATYWIVKGAWDKCIEIGTPAVEPLIAALKHGNKDAARALGQIGDARAIEPLYAALEASDRDMRLAANLALRPLVDSDAVKALLELQQDEEKQEKKWRLRSEALSRSDWQAVLLVLDVDLDFDRQSHRRRCNLDDAIIFIKRAKERHPGRTYSGGFEYSAAGPSWLEFIWGKDEDYEFGDYVVRTGENEWACF